MPSYKQIEECYASMTSDELAAINPEDLTEEGKAIYYKELKRRETPEWYAEEARQNIKYEAHIEDLDARKARRVAMNKTARKYPTILSIFLTLPVLIYVAHVMDSLPSEPSILTEHGKRNLRIQERQLDQLSPEDRRYIQQLEEGELLAYKFAEKVWLYGGGMFGNWLLYFVVIRMLLGIVRRHKPIG